MVFRNRTEGRQADQRRMRTVRGRDEALTKGGNGIKQEKPVSLDPPISNGLAGFFVQGMIGAAGAVLIQF